MSKISINEIAKLANVSKSTVSRYLNNGYLSEEKKITIKKVIEEHDYVPNENARNIKLHGKKVVAVLVPRFNSHTVSEILKGIFKYTNENNIDVEITCTFLNQDLEATAIRKYMSKDVTKIISLSTTSSIELIKSIKGIENKIIFIGKNMAPFASIYYDEKDAMSSLIENIVKEEKKIVYFTPNLADQPFVDKLNVISDFCASNNKELKTLNQGFEDEQTNFLSELYPKYKHFICGTDKMAMNIYGEAIANNLKIGEEIFIAGFGDYDLGKILQPPLTTVHYPYYEAGVLSLAMSIEDILKTEPLKTRTVKRISY